MRQVLFLILTVALFALLAMALPACEKNNDADDADDDHTMVDDDNDTFGEGDDIFGVICGADGEQGPILSANTIYDFDFQLWTTEGAGEAIRKFVLTLPCAEYELDLATLVAPAPLIHAGETPGTWQVAFDAETHTITYEYFEADGAAGVGNIRARESLLFSFTATTNRIPGNYGVASSNFGPTLVGDGDSPTVIETFCGFPVPACAGDDDFGDSAPSDNCERFF